jgi:hypothetical protein
MERFIEKKCAERSLTKAEEDELYPLREWLKFSDQELAMSYDAIKEKMERVLADKSVRQGTVKPVSITTF